MNPKPPRYEAREMGPASLSDTRTMFGLFDTFQQTFVAGQVYATVDSAISAARRLNAAYERAMEP